MSAVITHREGKGKEERIPETDSGLATDEEEEIPQESLEDVGPYKREIVWGNVGKFTLLHCLALYGVMGMPSLPWQSWAWLVFTYWFAATGITAGAHRLWAHKTYKASLPLQLFLMVANSMAGQNSAYVWARDHRLHHKCSETNGDPHNSNRGFFFSHVGWLLVRKHPAVKKAGKSINMSDLEQNSLVMFQHRHYLTCYFLIGFVLPTILPNLLWGEDLTTAYIMAVVRYVFVLHSTWLVNSAAHMFGMKPYDNTIGPAENMLVSILAVGEGFHNYHHTFPYDYSTSEWGFKNNVTTMFLDTMSFLGLAWDFRTASPTTVAARALRTGEPRMTRLGREGKAG